MMHLFLRSLLRPYILIIVTRAFLLVLLPCAFAHETLLISATVLVTCALFSGLRHTFAVRTRRVHVDLRLDLFKTAFMAVQCFKWFLLCSVYTNKRCRESKTRQGTKQGFYMKHPPRG